MVPAKSPTAEAPEPRPKPAKVLVVDDSRAMRALIVRMLGDAGLRGRLDVLEAASGAEALEVIGRERPDLVLADCNMPGMSGLELHRAAKAQLPSLRFGLITSDAGKIREQALEEGAEFVIAKPFSPQALRGALGPLNMEPGVALPCADALARALRGLFGVPVEVTPSGIPVFTGTAPVLVGVFEEEGRPRVLVGSNLELAARTGVALNGGRPADAQEWIRWGNLPETLMGPLRRFLEVCGSVLEEGQHTLVLKSMHAQLRMLPPGAVALAIAPKAHAVFQVEIAGWDGGAMTICLG